MAITHSLPGQVIDVGPIGVGLAAQQTVALFKSRDLEVMRLVLQAGKSLPPHKVPGEITIHCIEGSMSIATESAENILGPGQMLYLRGNEIHGVVAIEDSSALVTVALLK